MLSWAVWFKFLLNKVIANTCLFILTSFSKQSASWKVLKICELCALSTDSRKTYSVNKCMYTGSSSYSFDWGGGGGGGNNPLGGKKRKRPRNSRYANLIRSYAPRFSISEPWDVTIKHWHAFWFRYSNYCLPRIITITQVITNKFSTFRWWLPLLSWWLIQMLSSFLRMTTIASTCQPRLE